MKIKPTHYQIQAKIFEKAGCIYVRTNPCPKNTIHAERPGYPYKELKSMTVKLPELWLQYAGDDLRSAKILLAEGVYNVACFHAQQAVEKLLKAFIAA